ALAGAVANRHLPVLKDPRLRKKLLDRIRVDRLRRTDRRSLNISVPATGWRVLHILPPVDSQCRIDRCNEIVDHGLPFVTPSRFDPFAGQFVRSSQNALTFDTAADKRASENFIVVVASGRIVDIGRAPEFAASDDEGFVQETLSWLVSRRRGQVFEQGRE